MAKKTGKAAQRRAREAAARAAVARARKRQQWTITVAGIAVVVVLAAVVTAVILVNRSGSPAAAPTAVPKTPATTATGRTSTPPWGVPGDTTAAVNSAGLPMLGSEGTVEHIHIHLDIDVNGKKVTVPADIGIDEQAEKISPLHTHDTTGIVHIESPTKATFTLGQFFTEWQVSMSADHLGGLKAGGGKQFHAYVNGTLRHGDPAAIVFHAHDEIALVYGTAAQQKNPPSKYVFPSGY
jgi:hypothetical protein